MTYKLIGSVKNDMVNRLIFLMGIESWNMMLPTRLING